MSSTGIPRSSEQRRRLKRLALAALALLLAGLAYAALVRTTGAALPCPFHALTGLECPGCGVTRMCLALLELDPGAAWRANQGLFVLLPFLAVLAARLCAGYVRTGRRRPGRGERAAAWAMVVWLLGWGVVRNVL